MALRKTSRMRGFSKIKLAEIKRDVFYVRRVVDLMKTTKVNANIMYIFGKIEFLSIHTT